MSFGISSSLARCADEIEDKTPIAPVDEWSPWKTRRVENEALHTSMQPLIKLKTQGRMLVGQLMALGEEGVSVTLAVPSDGSFKFCGEEEP